MAWIELFRALALVCVIEGLMPFLAPARWRETLQQLADVNRNQIRGFGAVLIGIGVVALQFIR